MIGFYNGRPIKAGMSVRSGADQIRRAAPADEYSRPCQPTSAPRNALLGRVESAYAGCDFQLLQYSPLKRVGMEDLT